MVVTRRWGMFDCYIDLGWALTYRNLVCSLFYPHNVTTTSGNDPINTPLLNDVHRKYVCSNLIEISVFEYPKYQTDIIDVFEFEFYYFNV